MKKLVSLTVAVTLVLSLASCGAVTTQEFASTGKEAPQAETVQETVLETEVEVFDTLGISLVELITLIEPVQELHTIATYKTDDFTISKEGSDFWGTVCFALPGNSELSTILFLSDDNASSSSYPRKAATGSLEAVENFCNEKGIEVNTSEHICDSTLVLSITARDCPLQVENLPISVREYRPDNEFLANDERRDTCRKLLKECKYTELYNYISEFTENSTVSENDIVQKLHSIAESLSEFEGKCDISTDNIENKTTVYYKGIRDISKDINVIPFLTTSDWVGGISLEYKLGFKQNGWLFFDEITVANGVSDPEKNNYPYDVNRDVISGSAIQEYVYSYIDIASFVGEGDVTIRFSNTETKENIDHILTEAEKEAITTLNQIKKLHSDFFFSVSGWEDM